MSFTTQAFQNAFSDNLLSKTYPLVIGISEVCMRCCGNPIERYGTGKCFFCKKAKSYWVQRGFQAASDQLIYLFKMWKTCGIYRQQSTGIKDVDNLLIYLWGKPSPSFVTPTAIRRRDEVIRNLSPSHN